MKATYGTGVFVLGALRRPPGADGPAADGGLGRADGRDGGAWARSITRWTAACSPRARCWTGWRQARAGRRRAGAGGGGAQACADSAGVMRAPGARRARRAMVATRRARRDRGPDASAGAAHVARAALEAIAWRVARHRRGDGRGRAGRSVRVDGGLSNDSDPAADPGRRDRRSARRRPRRYDGPRRCDAGGRRRGRVRERRRRGRGGAGAAVIGRRPRASVRASAGGVRERGGRFVRAAARRSVCATRCSRRSRRRAATSSDPSVWPRPRVSSVSSTPVSRTCRGTASRTCSTLITFARARATSLSSSARPPGRSGTRVKMRTRRPASVSWRRSRPASSPLSTLPPETIATVVPATGARRPLEQRRHGDRAGALGDELDVLGQEDHRFGDLVLARPSRARPAARAGAGASARPVA